MFTILRSTAASLPFTYLVDDVPTSAGASPPNVTVRKADGTTLASGAAVADAGVGRYHFNLTAAQTAALNCLTVTWVTTGATPETFTTTAEVVGSLVVPRSALRAMRELAKAEKYSDLLLDVALAAALEALEDALGVAVRPRYGRTLCDGTGGTDLLLDQPETGALTAVQVDGVALTSGELAALVVYGDEGLIYRADGWPAGRRNIVVEYERGFAVCPARIATAAKLLAKRGLLDSPINDRATSMTNDDGTVRLIVAGIRGAVFDVPEANAVVKQYGYARVG